jgi:hypothetical protein
MGLTAAWAAVLAAATLLAGCGGGDRADSPRPETPAAAVTLRDGLVPAPPGVAAACARARLEVLFPVRCPARWPPGTGHPDADFGGAPRAYLLDFANGWARHAPKVFHLLLGGQAQPFGPYDEALRISKLQRVPMQGGGMFTSGLPPRTLGTADVHGARARILSEPPYPQGGIHGGHVVVTWNEGGHGYLVSVHASNMSRRDQVRVAVAMARSAGMPPGPAGG